MDTRFPSTVLRRFKAAAEAGFLQIAPPHAPWFAEREISPWRELGAWEWLWLHRANSWGEMAEIFRHTPGILPSDVVPEEDALAAAREAHQHHVRAGVGQLGVRVNGSLEYPQRLREAPDPPEVLFYLGNWDLVHAPRLVSVVGTRAVSERGMRRTRKLVQMLVERKCGIVSGLSRGVDAVAHEAAIENGGWTIGVAGSPVSETDPSASGRLQHQIAAEHLLISPVPVLRYQREKDRAHRMFFGARARLVPALAQALIVVEAGEVSGTVLQAELALRMGRKVFILTSCFDQPGLSWPAKLESRGAVRVREFEQIIAALRT